MQDLRLIGVHEDGGHLLLADEHGSRFRVALDEALRAAARRHRPHPGHVPVDAEPAHPPREVQALIRAGLSAEEVADRCGWPVEKVHKYEVPILAEREYVAGLARLVRLRPRGSSSQPSPTLAGRVVGRLGTRGVDVNEVSWDAWRQAGSEWTVVLTFPAGGDSARPPGASTRRRTRSTPATTRLVGSARTTRLLPRSSARFLCTTSRQKAASGPTHAPSGLPKPPTPSTWSPRCSNAAVPAHAVARGAVRPRRRPPAGGRLQPQRRRPPACGRFRAGRRRLIRHPRGNAGERPATRARGRRARHRCRSRAPRAPRATAGTRASALLGRDHPGSQAQHRLARADRAVSGQAVEPWRRLRRAFMRSCVTRVTPATATRTPPATAAISNATPSGREPVNPR